jgi:DNA invertase Pin-like site-specific DNA recombinase
MQTLPQDLHRDQRHRPLPLTQAEVADAAVVTLLSYGCPVQAIVAAFGLDERTVARWQRESGIQCRRGSRASH